MEQLGGVKAERADITPVENRLALVAHAERMGAVIDDLQTMPTGYARDAFHVTGVAEHVGRHDRTGLAVDSRLDGIGVQVPGSPVYIGKYRADTLPLQRTGRGDKTERCGNGVAGQAQCPVGNLQCKRTVVGQDDIPDPKVVAQARFELRHERAVIGQPTR